MTGEQLTRRLGMIAGPTMSATWVGTGGNCRAIKIAAESSPVFLLVTPWQDVFVPEEWDSPVSNDDDTWIVGRYDDTLQESEPIEALEVEGDEALAAAVLMLAAAS